MPLVRWLPFLLLALLVVSAIQPAESQPERALRINVVPTPSILPSDAGAYESIVVWLSSADRRPVIAQRDIAIFLTSSNLTVGSVETSVVIPKGSIFAVAGFKTTTVNGSTVVTASSQGYQTSSATVKTILKSKTAARLAIYASPSLIPAAARDLNVLVVQLLGLDGGPATSPSEVNVILSSNNTSVAATPASAVIPAGKLFARVPLLKTQPAAGATNITVQASGLLTSSTLVRMFNFPSNVTIGADPQALKIGERARVTVRATSLGLPIAGANVTWKSTAGLVVNAASSTDSNGIAAADYLLEGQQNATVSARVTSIGYEPRDASISLRIVLLPLRVTLLHSRVANVSQQIEIQAVVISEGRPVADANIEWMSDRGEFTQGSSTTDGRGVAVTGFKPNSNGTATITASVSKTAFAPARQSSSILVVAAQIASGEPQAQAGLGATMFIIPVVVLVGAVAVIFVVRRRRRAAKEEVVEEELV